MQASLLMAAPSADEETRDVFEKTHEALSLWHLHKSEFKDKSLAESFNRVSSIVSALEQATDI